MAVAAETRWAAAFYSRHCKRKVLTPSPQRDPSGYVDCLIREVSSGNYDMIVPMEDDTVALLGEHRSRFAEDVEIPIPPDYSLALALDKWETIKICQQLSIPVPVTHAIDDLSQLDDVSRAVPYPAVIKPRRSSGARGIARTRTPEEIRDRYRAIHRVYPFPLIQEPIPLEGAPLAVGLLFDRQSEPVAALVQRSLREYPPTGGSSTLRESIADTGLCDQATALLKELKWYGVAQVEFKLDPRDGRAKVMEINPRFWNSIQLAIDAGVNFPALLHRMATGKPFLPVFDSAVGIRSRWLMPGDILDFLASPDRFTPKPSFFAFFDRATRYTKTSPWTIRATWSGWGSPSCTASAISGCGISCSSGRSEFDSQGNCMKSTLTVDVEEWYHINLADRRCSERPRNQPVWKQNVAELLTVAKPMTRITRMPPSSSSGAWPSASPGWSE